MCVVVYVCPVSKERPVVGATGLFLFLLANLSGAYGGLLTIFGTLSCATTRSLPSFSLCVVCVFLRVSTFSTAKVRLFCNLQTFRRFFFRKKFISVALSPLRLSSDCSRTSRRHYSRSAEIKPVCLCARLLVMFSDCSRTSCRAAAEPLHRCCISAA